MSQASIHLAASGDALQAPGSVKNNAEGGESQGIDPEFSDPTADLTLVSSDAKPVSFRIHSYYLLAASPVFRSMIYVGAANTPPVLTFTDTIERASILRLLLRLTCIEPSIKSDLVPCVDMLDLIRLAQKWDCASSLRNIELFVRQPITSEANVFHRFFYACTLNDAETAARFYPEAAALTWPERPASWPKSVHESLGGSTKLDPANMSSFWIDQLPRKYFLALLRSSRLRAFFVAEPGRPNSKVPTPWPAVAEDFKLQLKLQEK